MKLQLVDDDKKKKKFRSYKTELSLNDKQRTACMRHSGVANAPSL